ncbi:MAG: iron ABC transporter substrate-binding protein [Chloroflexi bacterium]|nr:iron ABC transporter substrate-binding protein [Chloroflexota bacterium]
MRKFRLAMLVTGFLLSVISPISGQEMGESLVIYSGRSQSLVEPIFNRFSEDTGIPIEVRYAGTTELAATILEEGEASPADVFVAQDAGALGALAYAGQLAALPPDITERVEARFQSPAGLWIGLSGRARVLVYDTEQVTPDQLPASLLDLTGEEWRGRVGWAPTNASFQANVTAMRALWGEEVTETWLKDMIANDVRVYPKNTPIVQAAIDGEIAVGLVNHYYLYRFLAEDPSVTAALHYFPNGDAGTLVNIAGAAILNTSENQGLAQRFILYLLGAGAQTYFAEETYEYPLAGGVEPSVNLVPLAEIEVPELDLSDLADLAGTVRLLTTVGALP